jgi:hypothetical protein
MPPKILTAFEVAGALITSAVARYLFQAAILAALAATAYAAFTPPKRVGIDWERLQFMPREEQEPIVPETPHGPAWYVEPRARQI